jgi:hypothetical protein
MESGDMSRRFEVEGDLIVATGKVNDDLIRKVHASSRPLLVLNRELGFDEVDCRVLQEVGYRLIGLEVSGSFVDDSDVRLCCNLEELNLNSACRAEVEWGELAHLTHLFTYADRLSGSFVSLESLCALQLYGVSDERIGLTSTLPLLEDLTLISTRMRTVESMEGLGNRLRSLSIREASALRDFDSLANFRKLQRLFLTACRHLSDLAFVSSMPLLETLSVSDCGPVDSLHPLEDCPRLQRLHFYGSTNIQDGDLSVLDRLPVLEGAFFQSRRHYRGAPSRFPTLDD